MPSFDLPHRSCASDPRLDVHAVLEICDHWNAPAAPSEPGRAASRVVLLSALRDAALEFQRRAPHLERPPVLPSDEDTGEVSGARRRAENGWRATLVHLRAGA